MSSGATTTSTEVHLADAIELLDARLARVAVRRANERPTERLPGSGEDDMSTMKLHVLKPSVNNLTRCASSCGLRGSTSRRSTSGARPPRPSSSQKNPAHLTPMIEEAGLPRATLWESCAIMQYLCNKHDLDQFYPRIRRSGRWSTARCSTSSARSTRWSPAPPIRRSASRSTRAKWAPPTPTTR